MNILLLGNGFDLHHTLLTRYVNFLNVLDFLVKNGIKNEKALGDILGNPKLTSVDDSIKKSFNKYEKTYSKIVFDSDEINQMISLVKNNMWFKYLLSSLNRDVNWIDFEKEIAIVVQAYQHLFDKKISDRVKIDRYNSYDQIIIKYFGFPFINVQGVVSSGYKMIKDEYLIECPQGSNIKMLNKEEVIKVILKELRDLAEALKLYLKLFVDSILDELKKDNNFSWSETFENVDAVITFNYTNTFEKIYNQEIDVYHLHGNVNSEIVLGINPDNADNLETIDTSFVNFKKYFQRTMIASDREYIEFFKNINQTPHDNTLYVIGHSLDVTDKDIIADLFRISDNIYILNYDDDDKEKHFKNLINIFGKDEIEDIRKNTGMMFVDMEFDLSDIMLNNSFGLLSALIYE